MSGSLPTRAVLGVALGSLGAGVYSTVPTVLLLFFCTEILRIGPSIAATIVLVPKVWAILWDPLVGVWSDRSRSRLGRRAPFILVGSLGVAGTFALLFNVPQTGPGATVLYMMVVYFAMASAYSLFAVPYVAIPAEISSIAAERERLLTWRMTFAMAGVLLGAGVAPHLVERTGGGRAGYATMSLIVAATCGVAMLTSYYAVRRHHTQDMAASAPDVGLKRGLALIAADSAYVRLWFVYLLAMSGASLFIAMVPYFITRVIGGGEGDAGTALLALLLATTLSLPLWTRIMRRLGGWRALAIAMLAYALVAAVFILVPHGASLRSISLLFFLIGIPFGGIQLLPFTLLAHLAHAASQSSARQEGLYTGIWTAGEKLALAIGPAAAGVGLALTGYVSGAAEQSAAATNGLQLVMALGPIVFLLPSLALLASRQSASMRREVA